MNNGPSLAELQELELQRLDRVVKYLAGATPPDGYKFSEYRPTNNELIDVSLIYDFDKWTKDTTHPAFLKEIEDQRSYNSFDLDKAFELWSNKDESLNNLFKYVYHFAIQNVLP